MDLFHWFLHLIGVLPRTPSTAYNFWSGFGSDLTYLAILGAAWRHLNCHAQGCWRLAKHQVEGTPYKTCRKHHPTVPNEGPTVEHIHAAHAAANPKPVRAKPVSKPKT